MSTLYVRDLIWMVQREYEANQCPYAENFLSQVKFLCERLGDIEVAGLTFERIEAYKLERVQMGRARDTVNKELNGISKGLKIAVAAKLITPDQVPTIKRLRPGEPRSGFLYVKEFRKVREAMRSDDVCDVIEFAYWSGWRRGEVFNLRWDSTNDEWALCYVKKNRQVKAAPLSGHLGEIIARRCEKKIPSCPWVFHRKGKQVKCVRRAWNSAVRKAGVNKKVFHDMRRSFCRNAIRIGIDRDTVLKLSGHKTDSILRRYNIQDERDLLDAAKRLKEM